jgi:hypothetical protein
MNGPKVVVEAWMAQRLGLPLGWDGGVTTREDRREAIRQEILGRNLGGIVAGKRRGEPKPKTWAQLFERVYSEPLQPKEP